MLSVVILSASAAFAADDVAGDVIAIDDEITIDEPLAVEETPAVSANESAVVTKDTFSNYFDGNGTLNANVTDEELTFNGEFADVGVNTIVIDRPIILSGENATLKNIAIDVKASNVTVSGFTIVQNNGTHAISVSNASYVTIVSTNIDYTAAANSNGYAINAELADNLNLINNAITYVGATTGWEINNGVRVASSNNAAIKDNKFKLTLVSAAVGWAEVPAGSGNWVSSPISEGIVIDSSKNVAFQSNNVTVDYNNVTGAYDTIYAVVFKNSDYAVIAANDIDAKGHTYIYGIQMNGNNFTILENTIKSESDNYYANGIDIEGPATGVVTDNKITAKGVVSAYPIYSGMNSQNVSAEYINNDLTGEAYMVIGMSLGDVESYVANNTVVTRGNYTTGIATYVKNLIAENNNITLWSTQVGNESIWESFGVDPAGIKVFTGNATVTTNTIFGDGKGVFVKNANANINNNDIKVASDLNNDAYAVYAENVTDLIISGNKITFGGFTNGTAINNGIYTAKSDAAIIQGNEFDLSLVSAAVPWAEVPAGSGNWVSSPISEGIVVADSKDVSFKDNRVNVTYNSVVGAYDTIYAVVFKNSDNAVISENDIVANGHTYIYGIQMNGNNFTISENNITAESDNYYANGIDIEGPAAGVVSNNGILAKGVMLSYPIYSGMNGQNVSVTYTDNDLAGEAYLVLGMSLGDVESTIEGNMIDIKGNYTTGIASVVEKLTVKGNSIYANGTNVGNETIWESFGVETVGIKIAKGTADISSNVVKTTGDYSVKLGNTTSSVVANQLVAQNLSGDASVNFTGNATVKDNYAVSSKFVYDESAVIFIKVAKKGTNYEAILQDENGNVLANKTVAMTLDGKEQNVTTDKNGVIKVPIKGKKATTHVLTLIFAGDSTYGPTEAAANITVDKEPTKLSAKKKTTFKAKTKTKKLKVKLVDSNKKAIKKAKVTIKVKGKTYKAKTNKKGKAVFKITKLTKKGTHKAKIKYSGSKYYKAAKKTVKIIVK